MAQNTMAETPINTSIQNWIRFHTGSINQIAERLGIPAAALASAAAEEASHIIYDKRSSSHEYIGPNENFKDALQDILAGCYPSWSIGTDYWWRQGDIASGVAPARGLAQVRAGATGTAAATRAAV
jgi:hypothetical protein